jgi:hypothetical protein
MMPSRGSRRPRAARDERAIWWQMTRQCAIARVGGVALVKVSKWLLFTCSACSWPWMACEPPPPTAPVLYYRNEQRGFQLFNWSSTNEYLPNGVWCCSFFASSCPSPTHTGPFLNLLRNCVQPGSIEHSGRGLGQHGPRSGPAPIRRY